MKQIIVIYLIAGLLFPVKSQILHKYTFQEPHMGTNFRIIMYADNRNYAIDVARAAYDSVASLNKILSDYLTDSEVTRLNNAPAGVPVKINSTLFSAIEKSRDISVLTNGAFDITVGPVVELWRNARKENQLPDKIDLQSALRSIGYSNLQMLDSAVVKKVAGMKLDFGGIGKGMALSAAMQVINEAGINSVLIDAGGDILLGEAPPGKDGWEVLVGLFENDEEFQRKLFLVNTAIAGSGDLYQYLEVEGRRYSHIVDPDTGLGVTGQKRSTVIGPDASTADALASALCVMKPKDARKMLKKFPEYQVLVFSSGSKGRIKVELGKKLLK